MAKSQKSSPKFTSRVSSTLHPTVWTWVFIVGLCVGIFATIYALNQSTELRKRAATCSDNNCQNVKAGNIWMITNCATGKTGGNKQYCNMKGLTGVCRGATYCCPAAGSKWTTDMRSCSVPSPTPVPTSTPTPIIVGQLAVVPSISEPRPIGGLRQIAVTVSTFTNSAGQALARPTIWGTSEPDTKITISILPDGVSGLVTSDTSGKWIWQSQKTLTDGAKQLLVIAKKDSGQGQVQMTFTAVGGSSGGIPVVWILIIVMVVFALGFGGFVLLKTKNITPQKK
jgi:hypothetical protein